ncbi:MAG TPA: EamA family transporter [Candidatus Eisenbacteria bacterium]
MNQERTDPHTPRHYAAYAGMCLIWGSTFLAIRIGNEAASPIWAATLRLALATILLSALTLATGARFPRGAALRNALVFGFLNFGVNFSLLYWSELRVPSGLAAVLYATIPLSTGVFSWAFRLHDLDAAQIAAALVGLLGVGVIFSGELSAGTPPAALFAVLLAATSASLSGVFLKRTPQAPVPANAAGAALGAVVCFVASRLAGESQVLPRTFAAWWPILYLTLAGSLGAYILYSWLVTQWTLTAVATAALVIPVLAVLLGIAVRGESITAGALLGALLVLGAVAETLWTARAGEAADEKERPRYARILVPPPLLFLGALGLGLTLSRSWPRGFLAPALGRPLAVAVALAAAALGLAGLRAFRRAGTPFLPYRETLAIVTDGPFRFTRNPLYFSAILALAGVALWWDSLWLLALLPLVAVALQRLVIGPEERYLEARFGARYRDYRARVRRWF